MKKRLLSILLTLCMVLTLLPTPALAAEGDVMSVTIGNAAPTNYTSFETGWNAAVGATGAVTVKLLANWTAASASDKDYKTSFGTGAGFGAQCYLHVPENKTITLDLNGHTLDRGLQSYENAVSDGKVISVNGTLTLKDSGTNGKITGAYNSGGSAVDVQPKSTFTMQGGKITGNNATASGSPAAGGVYVGGTFTMTGGTITGNNATGVKSAGGVYMGGASAQFTMTGGTITNNTGVGAGGVLVATGDSTYAHINLTVGGTAQITGNKLTGDTATSNVLLQKLPEGSGEGEGVRKITCSTETHLTSGATIGVTTQTAPTDKSSVTITDASSANYSQYFFSDAGYIIQNSGTGDAQVVQLSDIAEFAGGDGSPGDPYRITNPAQLTLLATKVNNKATDYATAHYKLTNNINLSNATWTPIGNHPNHFKGTFDGGNHTITGMYVKDGNTNIGVFGYLVSATIKNLTVSGGYVSGVNYVGSIAGMVEGSTIENCHNTGVRVESTANGFNIGGIAGGIYNGSALSGCTNSATVSIAANAKPSGNEVCFKNVGGVVGMNHSSTVVNCVNYGAVINQSTKYYSSGLGGVSGDSNGTVTNCANYGAVTNSEKAQGTAGNDTKKATGGVVGRNSGTVTNCVNGGTVSGGTSPGYVGCVAGYNSAATAAVQFSYASTVPVVGENKGNITGCGTFSGTNGNITLGNDFVDGVDKTTKTETYVSNATTTLATALNSWVNANGAAAKAEFWAEDSAKRLVPAKSYTITFNPNGGNVATTSANTFGGKLSSLPNPTRDGHTFDGWFTAASGGTQVEVNREYTANTTIYAHWTNDSPPSGGGGDYIPPVQTTVDSGKEVSAFDLDSLASEGKTLTVNGKNGEKLVLDAETIKALAKAGGNLVVTVGDAKGKLTPEQAAQAGDRPVYDLTAILNGKIVTNFDGKITVSLPYLLKDGENAEDVTVWYLATDGSMTEIPATYDPKTGLATFTVTHFSKYVVGVWLNPFTDVKEGAWYFDAVKYVHKNGMFSGVSATTFAPNASTTRAMLWSVLARQAGQDTAGGANWYEKARAWAVAKGVSDGTNPTGDVTREQLVTMLWRYSGSPTATGDLSKFTDADSVSAYAKQAMAWAVEKAIVSGTTATTLSPKSNAARAELASIMMRYTK